MDLPEQLISEIIFRGQILLSDIFEEIDHKEFFVVMDVTEDSVVGFFFINSQINKYVNRKPEQLQLQYPILKKDYDFLSHDSYVCATSVTRRDKAALTKSFLDGGTKLIASLKEEHLKELLQLLNASPVFNKMDKKMFFS